MSSSALPPRYRPDPVFLTLGEGFSDAVRAADFPETLLRWRNDRAAAEIGLEGLDDAAWLRHFGRFEPLPDNLSEPLALRYHGHQFRVYNPDLGDGRGFLFAQMRDGDDRLIDLGTKGSGTTPWSRRGDGRLTLKGAVRELLATEMLEALGVPTSRTFSIVETGEKLWRGDEPSPTRSAVLVRMSHGHIRIGTFQRLAALDDTARIAALARYALRYYYDRDANALAAQDAAQVAVDLLDAVVTRTADLAASYMVAGFVHGVLNSDNINISGESFDYGPWRFTPYWDPAFTAAYFDEAGLYAFGRQPEAIHWNCAQLAISLRPLSEAEPLIAVLEQFGPRYQAAVARRFLWRLGLASVSPESDRALVEAGEKLMVTDQIPIDRFFFDWRKRIDNGVTGANDGKSESHQAFAELFGKYRRAVPDTHDFWQNSATESMDIDTVEALWSAIDARDDWAPLYQKVEKIRSMGAALREKIQ